MSDNTPAPAPSAEPTGAPAPDYSGLDFGAQPAPEPAAPSAPLTDGAAAPSAPSEPAPLHPSWEKTFDEAGIPEMLRGKLAEKIRADEAAVQRQIEAARGNVPPEWQTLLTDARESNVTPKDLVDSYHAMQQLRTDPLAFQSQLNTEIDNLVAQGHLTRAEGAQAKADAQQVVDNADDIADFTTPEAKEIAELRKRLDEREQAERLQREQEQQALAAQQEEQQLIQQYDTLLADSKTAVLADPRLAGILAANPAAAQNAQINVARLADSMVQGGTAATYPEAIKQAIDQLASLLPATSTAPTAPPVQGGSSTLPVPQAQKLSESDREAAMIAEGLRQIQAM